jgi:hypothetical protein
MARSMEAPGYILRVPDRPTPTDIAGSIAEAWRAGLHRARVGEARQIYLREHNFERYAVEMMRALRLAA